MAFANVDSPALTEVLPANCIVVIFVSKNIREALLYQAKCPSSLGILFFSCKLLSMVCPQTSHKSNSFTLLLLQQ